MKKFKNLNQLINEGGDNPIIYLKNNKHVVVTNYETQKYMIVMRYNEESMIPEWSKIYDSKEKYINVLNRLLKQQ
jgi:hypothetical protein|tara:strand:- start:373 stop:597 length:225 start_codon:yes stop_codon:yes gene_type:complete